MTFLPRVQHCGMSTYPSALQTRSVHVGSDTAKRLRVLNAVMGALHLVSGLAMVALSNDFTLPVSTFALNGPPGSPLSEGVTNLVFDLPLGPATASFLFLSAFPLPDRLAVGLHALRQRAVEGPQPFPLGGVQPLLDADDRPHQLGAGNFGHRGTHRARHRQRLDDLVRMADGDVQQRSDARQGRAAGPRATRLVDTLLVRLCRRGSDRGWPPRPT
jgi:hypothetical protein